MVGRLYFRDSVYFSGLEMLVSGRLTHWLIAGNLRGAAIGSSLKNYALYRSYLGKLDQHSPTQMLRPFLESVYPYMHHILYVRDLPVRSWNRLLRFVLESATHKMSRWIFWLAMFVREEFWGANNPRMDFPNCCWVPTLPNETIGRPSWPADATQGAPKNWQVPC